MPRFSRNSIETDFFHIVAQGLNKSYIFGSREDKLMYLQLLIDKSNLYNVAILSYCIMDNHVHILIYTPKISYMSALMKSVNTIYARYYNEKENRFGYVFRNRYLSQPIYNGNHLLRCVAYIHNNPVKARMVSSPAEYKFSSYTDYISKSGIINDNTLELLFGSKDNYLDTFHEIHKSDDTYLDINDSKIDYNVILNNFSNKYNKDISSLIQDDNLLIDLVSELRDKCNLSFYKISKILNISQYKLENKFSKNK